MNIDNYTPKEYLSHLEIFGTKEDRKTVSVLKDLLVHIEDLEYMIEDRDIIIAYQQDQILKKNRIIESQDLKINEIKKVVANL